MSARAYGFTSTLKSVVTGGTLTSDSIYFYRTFTGNGTLTISGAPLVADYLVVAGGGGSSGGTGFNWSGSGAGAGGLRAITGQTLSVDSYAITVGSGGAGSGGGGAGSN